MHGSSYKVPSLVCVTTGGTCTTRAQSNVGTFPRPKAPDPDQHKRSAAQNPLQHRASVLNMVAQLKSPMVVGTRDWLGQQRAPYLAQAFPHQVHAAHGGDGNWNNIQDNSQITRSYLDFPREQTKADFLSNIKCMISPSGSPPKCHTHYAQLRIHMLARGKRSCCIFFALLRAFGVLIV